MIPPQIRLLVLVLPTLLVTLGPPPYFIQKRDVTRLALLEKIPTVLALQYAKTDKTGDITTYPNKKHTAKHGWQTGVF